MGPLLKRREIVFTFAAIAATGVRAKPAPATRKILFVCQFGSVKSATARELLRRRAADRRIPVNVASRGITPEPHMTPELKTRLAADGIDPASEPLRKLEARDVAVADLVIAFDPLPSTLRPRRLLDWTDLPSMVNDYAHARTVLDARLNALLDDIAR